MFSKRGHVSFLLKRLLHHLLNELIVQIFLLPKKILKNKGRDKVPLNKVLDGNTKVSYFFCTNITFCVDVITKETHLFGGSSILNLLRDYINVSSRSFIQWDLVSQLIVAEFYHDIFNLQDYMLT